MKTAILLAALVTCAAAQPLMAQTRVQLSGSSHLDRPAQPSRPAPTGHPSAASPASQRPAASPFRWSARFASASPRSAFPVRLPWFGFVVFDPYWLAPGGFDVGFPPALAESDNSRPTGGLQIDVDPRRALVYADGWLMGIVDAFSGYYNHLDLPAGLHQIEIVAPGYEPLAIEVTVTPGRTATYRGTLNRARN